MLIKSERIRDNTGFIIDVDVSINNNPDDSIDFECYYWGSKEIILHDEYDYEKVKQHYINEVEAGHFKDWPEEL